MSFGEENKGKTAAAQAHPSAGVGEAEKDTAPTDADVIDVTPADDRDCNGDGGGSGNADAGGSSSGSKSAVSVDVGGGEGDGDRRRRRQGGVGGGRDAVCAAEGCEQRSRNDSKYCCEECGICSAQALLTGAVRHSLEMRVGLDMGRRLRETREFKTKKHQARRRKEMKRSSIP